LPHATIVMHQAKTQVRGQATDIQIQAKEVIVNKRSIVDIFADNTGQTPEKISKDLERMKYLTPEESVEYGLIDRVLESSKDLSPAAASLARV
jgi:ATP-dependent Clp protease, protease subunit